MKYIVLLWACLGWLAQAEVITYPVSQEKHSPDYQVEADSQTVDVYRQKVRFGELEVYGDSRTEPVPIQETVPEQAGMINVIIKNGVMHIAFGSGNTKSALVEMLDLRGKAVFHKQLTPSHSGSLKPAVPDLNRGVYRLKIRQRRSKRLLRGIPLLERKKLNNTAGCLCQNEES